MAVSKIITGKWLAEIYPEGRPSKANLNGTADPKELCRQGLGVDW